MISMNMSPPRLSEASPLATLPAREGPDPEQGQPEHGMGDPWSR